MSPLHRVLGTQIIYLQVEVASIRQGLKDFPQRWFAVFSSSDHHAEASYQFGVHSLAVCQTSNFAMLQLPSKNHMYYIITCGRVEFTKTHFSLAGSLLGVTYIYSFKHPPAPANLFP